MKMGVMKKWTVGMLLLGAMGLFPGSRALAAGMEADMVIYNGKILTADSPDPNGFTVAQAVALYDGKILVVGTNEEALEMAGPGTRKIDLAGRTVIPGIVETHQHIQSYAIRHYRPGRGIGITDDFKWTNKADALAQIRTIAMGKKPGEWIVVATGSGSAPPPGFFSDTTVADLDQVAPNNPVNVSNGVDNSMPLVNSKALELLLKRYPQGIAGLERDENGKPTGRLLSTAARTMRYEFWPPESVEELAVMHKKEMEEAAAMGMTTVSTRMPNESMRSFHLLDQRGEMPVRVAYTSQLATESADPEMILRRYPGMMGNGTDWFWVIGTTAINADHVPSTAGACVTATYPREAINFPLWRFQMYGPHGICYLGDEKLSTARRLVEAAAQFGWRITGYHFGGDQAANQYLDILEEVNKKYPITDRLFAIDHCRYITQEHVDRAKRLGMTFSCGPKYVWGGEKGDVGAFSILFGEEASGDSVVPLRRMVDAGVKPTLQSDQHGFSAFLGMEIAVLRKDKDGKLWGPQQRINRREALYAYTRWASEYVWKEKNIGTIEPGKWADLVVLDRDFLTIPDEDIHNIDPLVTIVGGQIKYTEPNYARSMGLPQVGFRENPTWWVRGRPTDPQGR
ncbi:MAG: amidohydrolase family protein [Acidobacteria bacterium]|nr:amidohydrolase family protein [Acidobacteriota bacterium]